MQITAMYPLSYKGYTGDLHDMRLGQPFQFLLERLGRGIDVNIASPAKHLELNAPGLGHLHKPDSLEISNRSGGLGAKKAGRVFASGEKPPQVEFFLQGGTPTHRGKGMGAFIRYYHDGRMDVFPAMGNPTEKLMFSGKVEKGRKFYVEPGDDIFLAPRPDKRIQRFGIQEHPEVKARLNSLKEGEHFTVGRDGDVILGHDYVSRKHLSLGKDKDGRLYVLDHSNNGTEVRGQLKGNQPRELHRGHTLVHEKGVFSLGSEVDKRLAKMRAKPKPQTNGDDVVMIPVLQPNANFQAHKNPLAELITPEMRQKTVPQRNYKRGEPDSSRQNIKLFVDEPEAKSQGRVFNEKNRIEANEKLRPGYYDGGHQLKEGVKPYREILNIKENSPKFDAFVDDINRHVQKKRLNPKQKVKYVARLLHKQQGGYSPQGIDEQWKAGQKVGLDTVLAKGNGVCRHRALLFKAIMDKLGVPAALVRGQFQQGDHGGPHVWNEVRLNGKTHVVDAMHNRFFQKGKDRYGKFYFDFNDLETPLY